MGSKRNVVAWAIVALVSLATLAGGCTDDGLPPVVTNHTPSVESVTLTTDEDRSVSIETRLVVSGDEDGLVVVEAHTAVHGFVVVSDDGTMVTFTPDPDYNGPASYWLAITDVDGEEAKGLINVDVRSVDDVPQLVAEQTVEIDEDEGINIDVLRDAVGLGDKLIIITTVNHDTVEGVDHGTAIVITDTSNSPQVNYQPDPNYSGSDQFTVTACDEGGHGQCSVGLVKVQILSVDEPMGLHSMNLPAIMKGREIEDIVPLFLMGQDIPDGVLSLTISVQPTLGDLRPNEQGKLTYYNQISGWEHFKFQIVDGCGGTMGELEISFTVNEPW